MMRQSYSTELLTPEKDDAAQPKPDAYPRWRSKRGRTDERRGRLGDRWRHRAGKSKKRIYPSVYDQRLGNASRRVYMRR
jgi:hypothetical protein